MALLVDEAGTCFDARCVEALRAITGVVPEVREPGLADAA
jgi:hypothetical protein